MSNASDDSPPGGDSRGPTAWPPSSYAVAAGVLSIAAAAVAVVASTAAAANAFAAAGYLLLLVGVFLRLAEYATDDRLDAVAARRVRAVRSALDRVVAEHGNDMKPPAPGRTRWKGWRPDVRGRLRGLLARARSRPTATRRVPGGGNPKKVFRDGIGLAVLLTFAGGALLVAWWQRDPSVVASPLFLSGWVLVLGGLAVIYAAYPVDGE